MDVILGMDYHATNDATIHPRKLTVSLPSVKGTMVVKAAPQQLMVCCNPESVGSQAYRIGCAHMQETVKHTLPG